MSKSALSRLVLTLREFGIGKSSHQRSQIIPENEVTGPMDDCASREISRESRSVSAARTAATCHSEAT